MQKLLQFRLRRRRAQSELAQAIVIVAVLAVAALVVYWYITTAGSITGRPTLRAGYTNTITATGGNAYVCVYNDGAKPITSATVTVNVVYGGTTYTGSAGGVNIDPGGSWCGQVTVKSSTGAPSLAGVPQVDATVIVQGSIGTTTTTFTEQLPTKLTVIGG